MKTIAFILVCILYFPGYEIKKPETKREELRHITDRKIDFKTQIQPILQKRCSPCHFPGGKMYERLPFDTASSLLLKKEIILKRIKDDSENKLIRTFIEENQN